MNPREPGRCEFYYVRILFYDLILFMSQRDAECLMHWHTNYVGTTKNQMQAYYILLWLRFVFHFDCQFWWTKYSNMQQTNESQLNLWHCVCVWGMIDWFLSNEIGQLTSNAATNIVCSVHACSMFMSWFWCSYVIHAICFCCCFQFS